MGKFPKKNQKCPPPFFESAKEKKSRVKSDFSNLVKSRFPDFRGGPSINPVHYSIYCLQRLLHVMHKVQLANGASHGPNSLPKHPSQRPLLHNYPIIDFQSRRKAEFQDSGLSASRNCHVWCLEELAVTVQLQAC